jgi:hydroxymethylbilane synthase
MVDIRGNVDTRLRKLNEGQFDAIVLAEAGLRRLGFVERITHVLPFDWMLPAVGQGALAIECRADDHTTRAAATILDDPQSHAAVLAERALLAHLRGGCMAPVGAY